MLRSPIPGHGLLLGGIKIVPGIATGTIRLAAVPDLVNVRAEGHDSEAVFDAPDADREVSGRHRGRCAREPRSGRTPCPFGKLLASLRLHHGQRSADADPRSSAVDGSDPPSRHASIGIGQGGDVHPHPPLRCGVAPDNQSLAGR